MMIKYLDDFHPQTLDDVLLRSQTLQAATGVVKETTVEAQVRRNWGERIEFHLRHCFTFQTFWIDCCKRSLR